LSGITPVSEFKDGLTRTIGFKPLLEGSSTVHCVIRISSIRYRSTARFILVCPNGADFDPAISMTGLDHEVGMVAPAWHWASAAVALLSLGVNSLTA
jgi:hypothetical protein